MNLSELKNFIKNALNEEIEAVASDGGYYNKQEPKIVITREEASHIKREAQSLYNQLFNGEKIAVVRPGDNVKHQIVSELMKYGFLDYDDEEGDYFYWIRIGQNEKVFTAEFNAIVDSLYDKIEE